MRFEHVYLSAIALIVRTSCPAGATAVALARGSTAGRAAVKSPPRTDSTADTSRPTTPPARHGTAPETVGLDPTTRDAIDLLSCLAKRWYSSDGRWNECHGAFSSVWNSAGDERDNEIGERRKGWNEQTLMMGAGFKLIVLIPALVILAGKAITLSLLSLLITFLGLLSMNSLIH